MGLEKDKKERNIEINKTEGKKETKHDE